MLDIFLKWVIPFLCGATVSFVGAMFVKLKAVKAGLQCLLRSEIVKTYDKFKELGYCPIYVKETMSKAYTAYHSLGGNDIATSLYQSLMELPTEINGMEGNA